MKRIPFILLMLLVLAVLSVPVLAQMGGPMHNTDENTEEAAPPYGSSYDMGPGMMGPAYGGYGYGMGPGMMGPGYGGYGYGMGPGMMRPGYGGYGYGMGPGMMGPGMMGPGYGGYGYGMGPGMMGPGYGGCGMMGPGYGYGMKRHGWGRHRGYGWKDNKEFQKFLDATHDLRKEINDKMFEFRELLRTDAPQEKIEAAWNEIAKLKEELHKKAQEMMK